MLNPNSVVVQNLIPMQSGFNPYNGYTPQQSGYNPYSTNQQIIQPQSYGYNPYIANQQSKDPLEDWTYGDAMPTSIVNDTRHIYSNIPIYQQNQYQQPTTLYNNSAFNGYMNPYLMKNKMEAEKISKREEAIKQSKIWKTLFKSEQDSLDFDDSIKYIESMYYSEPVNEDIPLKDKIIIEKNNYFAQLEAREKYCIANNIPIIDENYINRIKLAKYLDHVRSITPENCGMYEYFTQVYPELKYEYLNWKVERDRHNLKNRYDQKIFNNYIDEASKDKSDSYYSKLMESFSEDGVKLTNNDGLIITPDEMEIKLPDRLLKSKQNKYYEQRMKFFNSVFNKER